MLGRSAKLRYNILGLAERLTTDTWLQSLEEPLTHTSQSISERLRADFPILQQQIGEKPLIYFDNAATSQKPAQVIDSITDYYQR